MNGVRYPAGLTAEAVRLYVEEQISAAAVARRLGLKAFTVKAWLSERGVLRSMSEAASLSAAAHPRGRATARLWFVSKKDGSRHFAESSLEYLRMEQLDNDATVASWGRCPVRIPYIDPAGKFRNYVPDLFVVRHDGGTAIEEIKPHDLISHPLNRAKFVACRRLCRKRGWEFRILSERDVGYARAMAPSSISRSEKMTRQHLLRKQRLKNETPQQRALRLAKTAKYMRGFRAARKILLSNEGATL